MKPKKCKECKHHFEPRNTLQVACSMRCALAIAKKQEAKRKEQEFKHLKEKTKPKAQWMRETQTVFNRFIRLRDFGNDCISCGQKGGTFQAHAGHYLSRGHAPELRFNEENVHVQCAQCNGYKSGNIAKYRVNLVKKIGLDKVEWLEGPHEPAKYTIDELKKLKSHYSKLCRELEKHGRTTTLNQRKTK